MQNYFHKHFAHIVISCVAFISYFELLQQYIINNLPIKYFHDSEKHTCYLSVLVCSLAVFSYLNNVNRQFNDFN